MNAEFTIDVVPAQDLVRISMAGFFEARDISQFCQAMKLAHEKLTCGRNQHRTLVDIRGMHIQSQDAVALFGKVLINARYIARQLAVVVSRSLVYKQMQRAAAERDAQYFDNPETAEVWLSANSSASGSTHTARRERQRVALADTVVRA